MGATAYLKALLGLDPSGFNRGIDGAVTKLGGMHGSIRELNHAIHAAFAVAALEGFKTALSDLRKSAEEGIQIIDPDTLGQMEEMAKTGERIKLNLEGAAVTVTSVMVQGLKAAAAAAGDMESQFERMDKMAIVKAYRTRGKLGAAMEIYKQFNVDSVRQSMAAAVAPTRPEADKATKDKLAKAKADAETAGQSKDEKARIEAERLNSLLDQRRNLLTQLRIIGADAATDKEAIELETKIQEQWAKAYEAQKAADAEHEQALKRDVAAVEEADRKLTEAEHLHQQRELRDKHRDEDIADREMRGMYDWNVAMGYTKEKIAPHVFAPGVSSLSNVGGVLSGQAGMARLSQDAREQARKVKADKVIEDMHRDVAQMLKLQERQDEEAQ